jgi:hypothetical protein
MNSSNRDNGMTGTPPASPQAACLAAFHFGFEWACDYAKRDAAGVGGRMAPVVLMIRVEGGRARFLGLLKLAEDRDAVALHASVLRRAAGLPMVDVAIYLRQDTVATDDVVTIHLASKSHELVVVNPKGHPLGALDPRLLQTAHGKPEAVN